ncbi:MAG: hypothetical protein PF508_03520 [Spirochaeta sp.]|nr:hypothetical protein [Spirochaeta sp.]
MQGAEIPFRLYRPGDGKVSRAGVQHDVHDPDKESGTGKGHQHNPVAVGDAHRKEGHPQQDKRDHRRLCMGHPVRNNQRQKGPRNTSRILHGTDETGLTKGEIKGVDHSRQCRSNQDRRKPV